MLLAGFAAFLFAFEKRLPVWAACGIGFSVMLFVIFSGTSAACPRFAAAVLVLSVVLGVFCAISAERLEAPKEAPEEAELDLVGTVVAERAWGNKRAVVIRTPDGAFLYKAPARALFREGERVRIKGRVRFFIPRFSSLEFDEGLYWRARGVLGVVEPSYWEKSGRSLTGLAVWRKFLREKILLVLPKRTRGYVLSAWLGIRDPDLAAMHRKWGTSHLLAISGLHVGIAALGLRRFFRRSVLAPSVFMWVYVFLAGGTASAIRAATMFQLAFAGDLLGRRVRAVNAVPAAAVLILFWRPWWFWDIGWRLSVSAALLLGSFTVPENRRFALAGLPLVWYVTGAFISRSFGGVPLAGMIINVFAVPLYAVLLPVVSAAVLLAATGIPGASLGVCAAEVVLGFLHWCGEIFVTAFSFQAGQEAFPSWAVCAVLVFAVFTGSGIKRVRSTAVAALSGAFVGWIF